MADWSLQAGEALGLLRPFLLPGCEQAEHHPCRANPPCACRHAVRETSRGLVAVCTCPPGECEPFPVEPADLAVYELDRSRLAAALREALALEPPHYALRTPSDCVSVGVYTALRLPVWLSLPTGAGLQGPATDDTENGPGILLLPGDPRVTEEPAEVGERCDTVQVPFAHVVEPRHGGVFIQRTELKNVLVPRIENSRRIRRSTPMLEAIHTEISALRTALDLQPKTGQPITDSVAFQVFDTIKAMDDPGQLRKAPILQVFRLYCREGLTAKQVARKLGCARSLVMLRLADLRKRLGRRPSELRALAGQFDGIEKSMSDPRARKIHRAGQCRGTRTDPQENLEALRDSPASLTAQR